MCDSPEDGSDQAMPDRCMAGRFCGQVGGIARSGGLHVCGLFSFRTWTRHLPFGFAVQRLALGKLSRVRWSIYLDSQKTELQMSEVRRLMLLVYFGFCFCILVAIP